MNQFARHSKNGFTLIEIMAVVLIIGLLSTLVGIAVVPRINQGRVKTTAVQLRMLEAALETYQMDNSRYPSTEQGLEALITEPPEARNWQDGGYLRKREIPVDAWQNEFKYESPGVHNERSFDLWSYGADGVEGGDGIDADIGNWSDKPADG